MSLTGTPMENHLGELWAQFHFLLPGYLGDAVDDVKQRLQRNGTAVDERPRKQAGERIQHEQRQQHPQQHDDAREERVTRCRASPRLRRLAGYRHCVSSVNYFAFSTS